MSVLESVAVNLKKWRLRRGISASALARAANVSKSTISELERHSGNPSLETLWAIARALEVPLGFLLADEETAGSIRVIRSDERGTTFVEPGYRSRLLAGWTVDGVVEVYLTDLEEGADHRSESHGAGVIEYGVVVEGRVEIELGNEHVELAQGDLMSFPADRPHAYRAIGGPARIVGIHEYPGGRRRFAPQHAPSIRAPPH
jgi:transcriptional regulator with XRE-family HTH domain